jgi:hypothetical protein
MGEPVNPGWDTRGYALLAGERTGGGPSRMLTNVSIETNIDCWTPIDIALFRNGSFLISGGMKGIAGGPGMKNTGYKLARI